MTTRILTLFVLVFVACGAMAQDITLTSPYEGQQFYTNHNHNITWTSTANVSDLVKIEFSPDAGNTWSLLESGVNNNGTYSWSVLDEHLSNTCLIRISDFANDAINDVSDSLFIVRDPYIEVLAPDTATTLNGCESYRIRWNRGGISTYVRVYFSTNDGDDWNYITRVYIGSGRNYYDWITPSIATNQYRIKIEDDVNRDIYDISDAASTVIPVAESISITSPNGGESWSASSSHPITWDTVGTVGNVSMDYSTNAGASWTSIVANRANNGTYRWVLPSVSSETNALVRVFETSRSCIIDYTDNPFTIDINPAISITTPNGGNTFYVARSTRINWSASNLPTEYVKIEYSTDNGLSWQTVVESNYNRGYYDWVVPDTPSEECLIRISAVENATISDISDAPFRITPQTVTVISPNGGEILEPCVNHRIQWQTAGVNAYVKVFYSIDNGNSWYYLSRVYIASGRNYLDWSVPSIDTEQLLIKVEADDIPSVQDSSDAPSLITKGENYIVLTSPNGGEVLASSSNHEITWENHGTVGNVSMQYSTDAGRSWSWVKNNGNGDANNVANNGSYTWLLPANTVQDDVLLKIWDYSSSCINDVSDSLFEINNDPNITVTSPNGGNILYGGRSRRLNWSSSNLGSDRVRLRYSTDSGSTWKVIAADIYNRNYYDWAVPKDYSSQCLLEVTSLADTTIRDVSNAVWSIDPKSVTITSPNGGDTLSACSNHRIYWTHKGLESYVRIYYSLDGGEFWYYYTRVYIASGRNYLDWPVPSVDTDSLLIRIEAEEDPTAFDINDTASVIRKGDNYIELTSPNGGEILASSSNHEITWINHGTIGNISLQYSLDAGRNWSWVKNNSNTDVNNVANNGSYTWLLPANTNNNEVLVKIHEYNNNCVVDVSDTLFSIDNSPVINVTTPNGGNRWYGGASNRIRWSSSNLPGDRLKIHYSSDSGATWNVIDNNAYNRGYLDWNTPKEYTDNYLIRVLSVDDTTIADQSNATFSVVQQTLTVLEPNGNDTLAPCTNYRIRWSEDNVESYVRLYFSSDDGNIWKYITRVYIGSGRNYYDWSVPSLNSNQMKIRITGDADRSIVDESDTAFTTIQSANSLQLIAPNGGETWSSSTSRKVRWLSQGNVGNIDIDYSINGGETWNNFANNTANDGEYDWVLPANTTSEQAILRIYEDGNVCITDYSDNYFNINNLPVLTITSPNGGNVFYYGERKRLQWSSSNLPNDRVKLEYSMDNGSTWTVINADAYNRNYYDWTVPVTPSEEVILRVSNTQDTTLFDVSNTVFSIRPPLLTIETPNTGNENWLVGESKSITWTSQALPSNSTVTLFYSTNGGSSWDTIVSNIDNSGAYIWTLPNVETTANALVRIVSNLYPDSEDINDAAFTITKPVVGITVPNDGQVWYIGEAKSIQWNGLGTSNDVKLEISLDSGANYLEIVSATPNNGQFFWAIPYDISPSTTCLMRISDVEDPDNNDVTDTTFTIAKPTLELLRPKAGMNWYLGEWQDINWDKVGNNNADVDIELSTDNGNTWELITNTSNSGTYDWQIPIETALTNEAYIRISNINDASISDRNDAAFNILKPTLNLTFPLGGETVYNGQATVITWERQGLFSAEVAIQYSTDDGLNWIDIVENTANSSFYTWTPQLAEGSNYLLRIFDTEDNSIIDQTDNYFTISQPTITVHFPNGGENIDPVSNTVIRWQSVALASTRLVRIELSPDNGQTWEMINSGTSNVGYYDWIAGNNYMGSDFLIRITDTENQRIVDSSDNTFNIVSPEISFTSPSGGESWYHSQVKAVKWTTQAIGNNELLTLSYSTNGSDWTVIDNTIANTGSYDWSIPVIDDAANTRLRLSWNTNQNVEVLSNTFAISTPKPGDRLETAIVLGDTPHTIRDTTSNFSNQYANQESSDIFYQFTLPEYSDSVSFNISANFNVLIHLLDDNGTLISSSSARTNYTFGSADVTAFGTYYVVIEGQGSAAGIFDLNIRHHLPEVDLELSDLVSDAAIVATGDIVALAWNVTNNGSVPSIAHWTERLYIETLTGTNRSLIQQKQYNEGETISPQNTLARRDTITFPANINIGNELRFVLEIIPASGVNEDPSARDNNLVLEDESWQVERVLTATTSGNVLTEGSGQAITINVRRSGSIDDSLALTLQLSLTAHFSYPEISIIEQNATQTNISINAPNNDDVEGTLFDTVRIAAPGFNTIDIPLELRDNDNANLNISGIPDTLNEGDTINIVFASDIAGVEDIEIFLSSGNQNKLPVPQSVIIPAGQNQTTLQVISEQDEIPEVDENINITFGAANHLPASGNVFLLDDDLPSLELVLETNRVSESGGPFATTGILRRTQSSTAHAFTARLSASLAGTLIFPANISLAEGEIEKAFNVGVIDNDFVDGERLVTLTAAVYVSTCGCSAPASSSGSVSTDLSIDDNDGPTLKITASQLTMAEGFANAGYLRISRNTNTEEALLVNLSSSNTNEATIPAQVEIPEGLAYVDVQVTTIDDNITDGNQQVYFEATAPDFATGTVWIVVSDKNIPDLHIPSVTLASDTVQALDLIQYDVALKNDGFATAPTGFIVHGYLSRDGHIDDNDLLLIVDTLNVAISVGETHHHLNAIQAPNKPRDYQLIFQVNPNLSRTELVITNNTAAPENLHIKPDYTAIVEVPAPYYLRGNKVPVAGSATKIDGSPAALKEVEIYTINDGYRKTFILSTDESGHFAGYFEPLEREAGSYTIGASFPEMELTAAQDSFDIVGLRINNNQPPVFKVTLNDTLSGTLNIVNLSKIDIPDFTLVPVPAPNGATIVFETLPLLAGNATVDLAYTITDTILSQGYDYEVATLAAQSGLGSIQETDFFYYCQAPKAHLISDQRSLDVKTSNSIGHTQIELTISNNGVGESGDIKVLLPQVAWLQSMTPETLPSLASGDTHVVILKFNAIENVPFNAPINGSVVIAATNGNQLSIPFTFEKVSESTGTVNVAITNQFTYYTNDAPQVADAYVRIQNYFTGELYAEGHSDTSGVFIADSIPEGRHRIIVKKEKHLDYDNTITVRPADTTYEVVFINYQAITFDWSVEPTAVQDVYDINLVTTFETNVPMPVVTVEMPEEMPQLTGNETFAFNVILTNHGLITAKDVTLTLPQTNDLYEFVTNYTPNDLLAQQSIQVPVIMKRRGKKIDPGLRADLESRAVTINQFLNIRGTSAKNNATSSSNCTDFAGVVYWYYCGLSTGVWQQGGTLFTYSGQTCVGDGGPGGTLVIHPNIHDVGCAACPDIPLNPYSGTPVYENEVKSCVECINKIVSTAATCTGAKQVIRTTLCITGTFLSGNWLKLITCIPKLIPSPIKCVVGLGEIITICGNTTAGRPLKADELLAKLKTTKDGELGAAFVQIAANFEIVDKAYVAREEWALEYFGEIAESDAWVDLEPLLENYISHPDSIPVDEQNAILTAMDGYEIPREALEAFFVRWNTSIFAMVNNIQEPNSTYPDIINWTLVQAYSDTIVSANEQAIELGFESLEELFAQSYDDLLELLDQQQKSVCASVKVKFSQELTMTREAFEGTLEIYNGHPSEAMDTIAVNILITDADGNPANGHFEIQTQTLQNISDVTGTGTIQSEETAVITFLFIPERSAAPTSPQEYNFGGSVVYWDPYAEDIVTMPLADVTLTVNPSPDLMLHYFMQRNILSDDPLTSPEIEPTVPAELAVMVENHGYGPAVNMSISSAQPEIVENEKGLAIDFQLIGSNYQGQPTNFGVTDINFGTIPALETRIGQWYFTSTLLGKFVDYEADVVHASSFGNPDLSLVQGVEIHELTKSIVAYGNDNDNINDFLVNDYFDAHNLPDLVYYSQGKRTEEVYEAASGAFTGTIIAPAYRNTLEVEPADTGWNYLELNDPGNGRYELVSVTREDGVSIPLENAWLTFVTLPTGEAPVYENKFHIVDKFPNTEAMSYDVVWQSTGDDILEIVAITGVPDGFIEQQVTHLQVIFNKPINDSTFTYEDLSLKLQGGDNLIDAPLAITALDSVTYEVDLSALTTGNGYYNFTVQAADIQDYNGFNGASGRNITWNQYLDVPAVQNFIGFPENGITSRLDSVTLAFNVPIDTATLRTDHIRIYKDSVVQAGFVNIYYISSDFKTISVSGISNIITGDGLYDFVVDMTAIRSTEGNYGIDQQSESFTIDNNGPKIVSLNLSTERGLDAQHVTYIDIQFDEPVEGFNIASVELTRNGDPVFLSITQLTYPDNNDLSFWRAGYLDMLTYHEGNYEFTVSTDGLLDALGNEGNDDSTITWLVDRTTIVGISDLNIKPDHGYDSTDGITRNSMFDVSFNIDKDAQRIDIAQIDISGETVIATQHHVDSGAVRIPVDLLVSGNTGIKVIATAYNGIENSLDKELVIDETPIDGSWILENNVILAEQVDSVYFSLSDAVLEPDDLHQAIYFLKNGDTLGTVSVHPTFYDTSFFVFNLISLADGPGKYQLSIDLTKIEKWLSGAKGTKTVSVCWEVQSGNIAPLADAGDDRVITEVGNTTLDGTNSSDANMDTLTYLWVAPEGIVLDDTTSSTPSFPVTLEMQGNSYNFLLIVSDGELFSTDNVNITVDITGEFTYYLDADNDNYGVDSVSIVADQQPDGYVIRGGDCNDNNPDINPGAVEVVDNLDNNCNGEIDEVIIGTEDIQFMSHIGIKVFPIPSSSTFELDLSKVVTNEAVDIFIYNSLGILVDSHAGLLQGTNLEIGAKYVSGTYTLIAIQKSKVETLRMVKQ